MTRFHTFRMLNDRLPLTREGLGWLLLTTAMLLTGLIKSINLITLLGCLLLAIGIVNFLLAWRQVRGLCVEREAPEVLIAGLPNPWMVRVSADWPRARYGISLNDPGPEGSEMRRFDLEAQAVQTFERTVTPPRRGVFAIGPAVIRCSFPFGLTSLGRQSAAMEIAVAPKLGQLRRSILRRWLSRRKVAAGAVRSRPFHHPTGQMEFHGLRPFRPGDSPRHVHWRTSARRGELMVREFEEYPNDDLVLIVDLGLGDAGQREQFELMLSLAATIVWEWCRQKGDRLTVILAGAEPRRFAGSTGISLRTEILRGLATVEAGRVDVDAAMAAVLQTPAMTTSHLLLAVGSSDLVEPLEANLRQVLAVIDVGSMAEGDFFDSNAEPAET